MRYFVMLAPVLAPVLATAAQAAPFADLAAIDREVAVFAGQPIGQPGGAALPVDRRLRLEYCAAPLALGWYGVRRDTVLVQCPTSGWRVFVPLQSSGAGPQAAAAIARGDAVSITISGRGFAVSQPGEALEGGPIGAWIRVRSIAPGAAPLRALVIRPGVVGIELP